MRVVQVTFQKLVLGQRIINFTLRWSGAGESRIALRNATQNKVRRIPRKLDMERQSNKMHSVWDTQS